MIGTKLEYVMAQLALEEYNRTAGAQMGPSMRGRDSLFWFNNPKCLLHILHYILFQVRNVLDTAESTYDNIINYFMTVHGFSLHLLTVLYHYNVSLWASPAWSLQNAYMISYVFWSLVSFITYCNDYSTILYCSQ